MLRTLPFELCLHIGRASFNDLVLLEPGVSRQHATLWIGDGRAWIRDLGSTNGVLVRERRIERLAPLRDLDEIVLGEARLRLRAEGLRVRQDRVARSEQGEVLRLPGGRGWLDGESVEARGEGLRGLQSGRVEGWKLLERGLLEEDTQFLSSSGLPYRVRVQLDGPTGVEVRLTSLHGEAERRFTHNKAVVLYLLARRLDDDRRLAKAAADQGWLSDEELCVGIWGRGGPSMDTNGLHVLTYRLRKDVTAMGLDASCIEKRRGASRLCVASVEVPG